MYKLKTKRKSNGLTDVPGFQCSGVHCDVRGKNDGRLDLALVYSETACTAAGVFTQNTFAAAPVLLGREILATNKQFHGIITNSGNANACTGEPGVVDSLRMQEICASRLGVKAESIFVCSTGRIGELLPMEKIDVGIHSAVDTKSATSEGGIAAADAILTSDTCNKVITVKLELDGEVVTISGMAKGAGMIEPNMATMLAYVCTDAAISKGDLSKALKTAVSGSFNAITVDGDQSTNDTVLLLANGFSGVAIKQKEADGWSAFQEALNKVCYALSGMIVGDGEKITKVVELSVKEAASRKDAEKAARAIGNSLLVKSSWYGNDPNWGRLVDALGYSGAKIDLNTFALSYQSGEKGKAVDVYKDNAVVPGKKSSWKRIVSKERFQINISLGTGNSSYRLLASDLTEGYVDFNKSE